MPRRSPPSPASRPPSRRWRPIPKGFAACARQPRAGLRLGRLERQAVSTGHDLPTPRPSRPWPRTPRLMSGGRADSPGLRPHGDQRQGVPGARANAEPSRPSPTRTYRRWPRWPPAPRAFASQAAARPGETRRWRRPVAGVERHGKKAGVGADRGALGVLGLGELGVGHGDVGDHLAPFSKTLPRPWRPTPRRSGARRQRPGLPGPRRGEAKAWALASPQTHRRWPRWPPAPRPSPRGRGGQRGGLGHQRPGGVDNGAKPAGLRVLAANAQAFQALAANPKAVSASWRRTPRRSNPRPVKPGRRGAGGQSSVRGRAVQSGFAKALSQ